jgi:hypothetical protein
MLKLIAMYGSQVKVPAPIQNRFACVDEPLFQIGLHSGWAEVVGQVFRVKDFDRGATTVSSTGGVHNAYFREPYGYLLVESPILNGPSILPIIHRLDYLLAYRAFEKLDATDTQLGTDVDLLVTYVPKVKLPGGIAGITHALHFVFANIDALDRYYDFGNDLHMKIPNPSLLFGRFEYVYTDLKKLNVWGNPECGFSNQPNVVDSPITIDQVQDAWLFVCDTSNTYADFLDQDYILMPLASLELKGEDVYIGFRMARALCESTVPEQLENMRMIYSQLPFFVDIPDITLKAWTDEVIAARIQFETTKTSAGISPDALAAWVSWNSLASTRSVSHLGLKSNARIQQNITIVANYIATKFGSQDALQFSDSISRSFLESDARLSEWDNSFELVN